MDSRLETYKHILQVQKFINQIIKELLYRCEKHDQSKLFSPEKEAYDEIIDKLADLTYGSDEYMSIFKDFNDATNNHYKCNRHHPQHYSNGIQGMNLIDIIEMLCDWKAASLRHNNISLEINQERFGFSDELKQIFINTLQFMEHENA